MSATFSRGYTFGATETVTNAKLHALIDGATVQGIVNAEIAAGAGIESSKIAFSLSDYVTIAGDQTVTGLKTFSQAPVFSSPLGDGNLAQITTYQKVSGSAIGYLASVNASAGIIPSANLPSISLGSWEDKSSSYAAQQASTDGFVVACLTQNNVESSGTAAVLIGKTDSASTPSVIRGLANTSRTRSDLNGAVVYASFTMPVKKNEYWSVTYAAVQGSPSVTIKVYWMPLGA